jgi:mono/diheme cytochrome c family protein
MITCDAMRNMLRLLALSALLFPQWGVTVHADEALEQAARDFQAYCAPCHGAEGRGDGPVAPVLTTHPADLTGIARRQGGTFDAEAVYKKVEGLDMPTAHGTSEMPVWGFWFTSQAVGESILLDDARPAAEKARERISALVRYLETIQE